MSINMLYLSFAAHNIAYIRIITSCNMSYKIFTLRLFHCQIFELEIILLLHARINSGQTIKIMQSLFLHIPLMRTLSNIYNFKKALISFIVNIAQMQKHLSLQRNNAFLTDVIYFHIAPNCLLTAKTLNFSSCRACFGH